MRRMRRLWNESMTRSLVGWMAGTAFPAVKNAFFSSFLWACWVWFDTNIRNSRIFQYIFDPTYLTNAWYTSAFYRQGTYGIRRLSFVTPRSGLRWNSLYIGLFLSAMLLVPNGLWSDIFLLSSFFLLAVFYFSHHASFRTGTVFALVNITLLLFWAALALAAPYRAVQSLTYLLAGIDFFFLVSFSIRTKEDFIKIIRCIYVTLFALCCMGLIQQSILHVTAHASLQDGVSFGEIIVLLFPFAFICPMTFDSAKRRIPYLALLLMLTFTVVTATHSKAALIGFSAELLLLILLIDWRYLPILLFLGPAVTRTAVQNIAQMWDRPETYGNFFSNIFYAFRNFWNNGFGVNRSTFLDIYHSTALDAQTGHALVQIPYLKISPFYFTFLLDIGTLVLLGFLSYILRLAHSALTSLFTAPKEYRIYFAAGFATLIGISVSSMMESTLFAPRTLLVYWCMLGLLRAARIIRFGIIM